MMRLEARSFANTLHDKANALVPNRPDIVELLLRAEQWIRHLNGDVEAAASVTLSPENGKK